MSHHLLLLFSVDGDMVSFLLPLLNKQQHMLKEWYSNSYRGAHVVCPCDIVPLLSLLPGPFSFTLSLCLTHTIAPIHDIQFGVCNNLWGSSSGTKYVHVCIKAGDKEQGQWSSNVMGYQHARLQHFRGEWSGTQQEQVQVIDWTWRE